MWEKVRLVLPWLFTAAIVGWLLATVDLDALSDAFATADWQRLAIVLPAGAMATFLVDSGVLWVLFNRYVAEIRLREVLAFKGVSYFFNVIHYGAANGAISYFLKRRTGAPFLKGFASFVWLNFVDISAMMALLTIGLAFGGDVLPAEHAARLPLVLAVGWGVVVGALIYWWGGVDFLVLGKVRPWRIFETFRTATPRAFAQFVLMRLGFVALYALLNWAAVPAFGMDIPLGVMLIYSPMLAFVNIVPASISGLGAYQAVMIVLFTPYVLPGTGDPMAQVMGYSLVSAPGFVAARLLIGFSFVNRVSKELLPTREAIDEARQSEGAEI